MVCSNYNWKVSSYLTEIGMTAFPKSIRDLASLTGKILFDLREGPLNVMFILLICAESCRTLRFRSIVGGVKCE